MDALAPLGGGVSRCSSINSLHIRDELLVHRAGVHLQHLLHARGALPLHQALLNHHWRRRNRADSVLSSPDHRLRVLQLLDDVRKLAIESFHAVAKWQGHVGANEAADGQFGDVSPLHANG